MARFVALLAALVLLAGTATAAFAAPPAKAKADSESLIYQKTTKYIFDDEVVPVELGKPDGDIEIVRVGTLFDSLVQLRPHFIPEMLKACEDL